LALAFQHGPGYVFCIRIQITSWDIAREAQVSQATVSRVINNRGHVAPATRERVLAVIQAHGYSPNAMAQGLVTRSSRLVGVLVADVTNPFYPQLIEEIDARLEGAGLQMILSNDGSRRDEAEAVRLLEEQRVAGMIFISARLESPSVRRLVASGFPVALVNRYVDGVECDVVVGDNDRGMELVAEHLVALGHRRIALVAGTEDASTSRDRLQAFNAALAARGVALERVVRGDFAYPRAYAAALELLHSNPRPTAVATVNDLMALAVLNAADAAGLRVPDDLSVVGYDDIAPAGWERFALTTVRQPLAPMAARATELLARRMQTPDAPFERVVYPAELIERGSTATPED
jgi:LacI family transcriptional regulator, galactose operon repressor